MSRMAKKFATIFLVSALAACDSTGTIVVPPPGGIITPPPPPPTQTCWDSSVILATDTCPIQPPPPPPPPATQTCDDGTVILATETCPPPPPPVEITWNTRVKAVAACQSTMNPADILTIGAYYTVLGITNQDYVVLTPEIPDNVHRGDGYFAWWVPISCVVGVN